MKVPVVVLAVHSAGVLSFLLSATATWVSATFPGHTREYFASAAVPPPSNVDVVGTSTRLLPERLLNPSSPYVIPQRRVFPWHASFYSGKPELHYPILQDGQNPLGPYALKTPGGWEEAEGKASSVLRSAKEINKPPHFTVPFWTVLNGPVFGDGSPLPKSSQGIPDSGSLDNLLSEPLFHRMRFLREEKDDEPEGDEEVKDAHVDRRPARDDAEVEKKKKKKKNKKMQWAQEEREGPWEDGESEGEQGVKEKVQHEKKHDAKSEEERKSRQYEERGREEKHKADGGAGAEQAGVKESEPRRADDAKEGKKSGKDVQEAPPPVAVHEEEQGEEPHSSPPSSHAPGASYKKDNPAVEEKQRRQPEQPKPACAGVCHVYAKTERWEDADGRTKSQKSEALKSSPSTEPVSAAEPKAGASYKKDDAKGEKGAYTGEVGRREEAELVVNRSPDSFHRQRMEKEMSKEPSGSVRRMMFWPRTYVYYHSPHEYTYLAAPRAYWRPGFYFTTPRDDDDYYPVLYYRRWLREDASDSEKQNRSGHMRTGQVLNERIEGIHGVDCAPGSSCSISPPHTYHLTPTSDDVRQLEHVYSTADSSNLNSDKEYLHASY